MSRLANHGYNFKRPNKAPEQLSELLKINMETPEFKRIVTHLMYLTAKNLDPNVHGKRQRNKLLEIEAQLRVDIPDVFGGTDHAAAKRVYFAIRVVLHFHRMRLSEMAWVESVITEMTPKLETVTDVLDPTNDDTDTELLDDYNENAQRSSSSEPESIYGAVMNAPIQPVSSSPIRPPESDHYASTSTPTSSNASSSPYTSPSCSSRSKGKEVRKIQAFLLSCSPPLGHLLSRFMDVGFVSTAILLEVSSKWTKDERMELLKELPCGPEGESVTQLELIALERRFQRYKSTAACEE